MDELVERCIDALRENVFIDDAHLLGTTQQDMRMEHYTRAIIPIVAEWQRERDAGIAEAIAKEERAKAQKYRRPRGGFSTFETYHNSRANGANEVATAIRGSE